MDFFIRFWHSISNYRAYRGFIEGSTDKAMGYLALMVLVIGLPVLGYFSFDFMKAIDELTVEFDKVPEFVLQNGELEVNAPMPIISDSGTSIFIIDTTGQTKPDVLDDYDSGVLVFKDRLFQKENTGTTKEVQFDQFKEMTITKQYVHDVIPLLKWLSVLFIVCGLIYFFLAKLLTAAIMAFVALVISAVIKAELTYERAFRLTIYAITLPTIFQSLHHTVFPNYGWPGTTYWLLVVIYLGLGVWGTKITIIPTIPGTPTITNTTISTTTATTPVIEESPPRDLN